MPQNVFDNGTIVISLPPDKYSSSTINIYPWVIMSSGLSRRAFNNSIEHPHHEM